MATPPPMDYDMDKDEKALESPGEEIKYGHEHDIEAAPANKLVRELTARHMKKIDNGSRRSDAFSVRVSCAG